ncbi:hypothetical protein BK026_02620 [Alteromonas sp. V450]|uniref:RNA polymerase sigma factor n=1 Tax=Alteromonas sp. V450 TaxID=1912139 RepID=UPI0008FF4462|nr:sigma-70 family RNA polymerase sigma factor [Alteromonas sp. V450]OJF67763.1 hypothetical protein BK026_02620 [Alteromonas sp. V450]
MNDRELIKQYLNGSDNAFDLFYKKYKDKVFRYALGVLCDYTQAEEVAAISWKKFVEKVETINGEPGGYLFAILRSKVLDSFRCSSINKGDDVCTDDLEAYVGNIDHAELEIVFEELRALPLLQREVVLLKHIGGYTVNEIASLHDVSNETVKSRLRYALEKLRCRLRLVGGYDD